VYAACTDYRKGADSAPMEGNEKFLIQGEKVGRGPEEEF